MLRYAFLGLLVTIVLAMTATVWLVAEVRKEQHAIEEIVRGGIQEDIVRLGTLPGEVRWQLVMTVAVLVVLVGAGLALAFGARAYLRSQESLRRVTGLAWDILESMDHGVITCDRDGLITSVNRAARQLFGLSLGGAPVRLEEVDPSAGALVDASRAVLESGRPEYGRELSIARDAHTSRVRAECHLLRGSESDVIGTVLHVRDVTEQTLVEEQMRRMERYTGLAALTAGLHHEIKNPLGALSLHVQLLEEQLDASSTDEGIAESLRIVKEEVARIARVLESFRDYASVEALELAPADARDLLAKTARLLRPTAARRGVSIEIADAEVAPRALRVDSVRVEQVLLNLEMNAIEAMRSGGVLSLGLSAEDGYVVLVVSDSGPGIPEVARDRIFDPYYSTKPQGTGLGLAFCDKIVRQHGGYVAFETGPSGTTFRVFLPSDPEAP